MQYYTTCLQLGIGAKGCGYYDGYFMVQRRKSKFYLDMQDVAISKMEGC